jgi:hypothetical protein
VSQAGSWTYYPLTALPARYDIVLCRYPESGSATPGPKCRPALVRAAAVQDDDGTGELEVVYGTRVLKMDRRPFDLHVMNVAEMNWAGLYYPTRFDLDNRIWLPWAEEFFVIPARKQSPVLGALSPYMVRKLQEQYAYKQQYEQLRLELEERQKKDGPDGDEESQPDA